MATGVIQFLRKNFTQPPKYRFAFAFALIYAYTEPVYAQGASYEDEIEKRRKELFGPGGRYHPDTPESMPEKAEERSGQPKKEQPSPDPFAQWEEPATPGGVQFHADASITGRDIFYWKEGRAYEYGSLDDLRDKFLALPPPPIPPPTTIYDQIWQNNPPPNTGPYYDPLLNFLHNGPGGSVITLSQLQQITPSLLAVAPLLRQYQSGSISFYQLLTSPQGAAFLSVAQSILQPLGMWNNTTLYAWANYLSSYTLQNQLISILTTLESNLLAALNLPPGQYVTVSTTVQPPPINPFVVIAEMNELWNSGDEEEIAARYPALAHSLIKHLGFTKPQGILYANRKGRKNSIWPYNVGVTTEQRLGDRREVWVLNQSGFFINPYASGVGRYYQGPDDLTLSYVPFEVSKDHKITTLDVRAGYDYTLYKRAVGGDIKLLNRASTDSTGLIYLDIPTLGDHLHIRLFGGTTPYATTGGSMLRVDYGTEELFSGHIGGGVGYRETYFDGDHDDFIGYLETENIVRTPYLTIQPDTGERGFRSWASLTIAASGLSSRPIGKEAEDPRWTLQAEARFVPELHTQLATPYALFSLTGGVTTAIVPGGTVNLKHPERTLGLYPIRTHFEFTCRIKLDGLGDPFEACNLELGAVSEFSKLVDNTRFGARFNTGLFYIDYLTEIERYQDSSFTDVRVGGGAGFRGINLLFLQSLEDEDYRFQISIDVGSLLSGDVAISKRGLLDSYEN